MEDTLRVSYICGSKAIDVVLILVLMEDTLRVSLISFKRMSLQGLNPCFNGRYSQSAWLAAAPKKDFGLNPCFNGRYSQRCLTLDKPVKGYVLILVLMEDTLRELEKLADAMLGMS